MAFIVIDGDTSWQDLAIAEELATSYNRRRALCGLATIAAPTQATEVYAFVRALQEGIEAMADDLWLNNSAALTAYEGQASYPSIMSLSGAMTAAGLTASGYWRRIAEGGTQPAAWANYAAEGWAYGKITSKDLAGPWLFKDLQVAMSALTRALIPLTQWRSKNGEWFGYTSFPSTAMSWGAWGDGTPSVSWFQVQKQKTGSTITYAGCRLYLREFRYDISADSAAYESDRMLITKVRESDIPGEYASATGKTGYANLTAADVTTVLGETLENTATKSTADGITSYSGILGEDASNIIPLANNILPDANVPSSSSRQIGLLFDPPVFALDFAFE